MEKKVEGEYERKPLPYLGVKGNRGGEEREVGNQSSWLSPFKVEEKEKRTGGTSVGLSKPDERERAYRTLLSGEIGRMEKRNEETSSDCLQNMKNI